MIQTHESILSEVPDDPFTSEDFDVEEAATPYGDSRQ